MKIQKAILLETLRIALGTIVLGALMNVVFLVINMWDTSVLYGTLLGCFIAILNFFLLGITVQMIANDASNEKRGKMKLQFSYSLRMFAIIVILAIGVASGYFMWASLILPVFFPRITIALMQAFGVYKPEKPQDTKQENNVQEGD